MNESNEETNKTRKIRLTLLNGTGYVFNVDDYFLLREKYRITGSLVGTCNISGWSPHSKCLPAELNCYETQLLLDKGIVKIVSKKSSLNSCPNREIQGRYKETQEIINKREFDKLKAVKLNDSYKNIDKILDGKRKKLLRLGISEVELTREDVIEELQQNLVLDKSSIPISIPLEYPFKHVAEVVKYQMKNSFKYRVFCDLWNKGKYITSGESFGCDFLVYPGDPLQFHASHIVIVLTKLSQYKPLDLIAQCRLSVVVNKVCIYAYASEESNGISYQTVHWEGCKDRINSE